MKQVKLILLFVLYSNMGFAQKKTNPYAGIDNRVAEMSISQTATTNDIANSIMATFETEPERVRAIYAWLAQNIAYDVANMYSLNFYESSEAKMKKALQTRKGVCEHYALLFNDLCKKCGIASFAIGGYTMQNGRADYIPHAWATARVDGKWFLFDPTWGAGYIDADNGKYEKRLNNDYYMATPASLIESHMPFDPMWQLLNYPITNQDFYDRHIAENRSMPYFSYADSIAQYALQDSSARLKDEVRRVEANGVKNSMVFDYLNHLKNTIEIEKMKVFNDAVYDYNEGVNNFNVYINYWNKQFRPMRPDNEIQALFDACYNKITGARKKLKNVQNPGEQLRPLVTSLYKSIDDLMVQVDEQDAWLKRYFGKNKLVRSTMFMQRSR